MPREDRRKVENFTYMYEDEKYKYFMCKVCNKDRELFPYYFMRSKHDCSNKPDNLPTCGCYSRYRWSKEQYEIRVKRVLNALGYSFIEFIETKDRSMAHSKIVSQCDEHQVLCDTITINSLLGTRNTRMCPECLKEDDEQKLLYKCKLRTYNAKENAFIKHKNIDWGSLRIVRELDKEGHLRPHIYHRCNRCLPFLGDRGYFKTSILNFCRGSVGCACGGHYRYSEEEYTNLVNHQCNWSVRFVRWLDDEVSSFSKFQYICHEHGVRVARYWDWRSGNRCSLCSKFGFQEKDEAELYVIRWFNDEGVNMVKYGITNDFKSRLPNLKKHSKLKYEILYRFCYKVGKYAQDTESTLKAYFHNTVKCEKDLLPDGWFETVPYTQENIDYILGTIKRLGNYNNVIKTC